MVMFQRVEPETAGVVPEDLHRAMAVAKGRSLLSRVMHGPSMCHLPTSTPLVALHGISRDARALWQAFGPLALAEGRTLLVPRFTKREWPLFQQIGRARPDIALLDLFRQAGLAGQRIDLFGFSGGAQLAHRFAMLYPQHVDTLHLAAPGWYTLPDARIPAPLGLGPLPARRLREFDAAALSRLQLPSFLSLKVRLWIGALDLKRDASLRQTPALDALQGRSRLERACHYADSFVRAARARGIDPDISLTVLPGCGHDFTECATVGGLAERVIARG